MLDFLQSRNMDVLVAGDSMMRQLFIRLAHMMRGTLRVMDYHVHAHASYAVRISSSALTTLPALHCLLESAGSARQLPVA